VATAHEKLAHRSCRSCRIRVAAGAAAIAVLESRCPICGGALAPAAPASHVIGFRLFDLAPFAEQEDLDRRVDP
jgi:hypothetical protein